MRPARLLRAWGAVLLAAALSGCSQPAPSSAAASDKPPGLMNPCADRLQELCHAMLLYYAAHRKLPGSLDELAQTPAGGNLGLVCPNSGKPYVYNRGGLKVPSMSGRLVIYDAQPCHGSWGWGLLIEPSPPGQPLVPKVICITLPPTSQPK